ncbi:amino acid adenylation domain-containing protein [Polaromonas sp. P5_E6]
MTVFAVVVAKFSGKGDFCIGTPVAGRNAPEFFPLIGCFADTLVLRITLDLCQSFRENLLAMHKIVFGALAHQEMPFDCLVEELNPPRDDESSPIFQMLFALHTEKQQFSVPRSGIGRSFRVRRRHTVAPRYGLSVDMYPTGGGGFETVVEYDEGRTSKATIVNVLGCMERLLDSAKACLDHPVGEIDILNVEDRLALQRQKAETFASLDGRLTLYKLFLAQADKHPESIAIEDGDRKITYGALKADVLLIAERMQVSGVRTGDLIAVIFDRSIELVTAILAVWGAGAAYLPLDPVHPIHRLAAMLLDAKPLAILLDDTVLKSSLLGVGDECDELARNIHLCLQRDHQSTACQLDPSAAYAIYTSGSTGMPKAAVVMHLSLVNLILHMKEVHSITEEDTILSVTSPSFDLGGSDIFLALCCGGRLVLASRSLSLDAPRLLHLIKKGGVTILQATPATWSMLNAADDRESRSSQHRAPMLRVAICGGEALSRKLVPFLCRFSRSAWNYYGPTETTVWSTSQKISETDVISVGRPIANTQILIVDSSGSPAPSGAIGELWIGGAGVALGYLNRTELTKEKFLIRSFFGEMQRFYRTGDIGRYRADGSLQLIGRNDRQTKIRGFRVELEEIESVLTTFEDVEGAHVRQETLEDGTSSLSGFIVLPEGRADAQILRRRLSEILPQYMVPDVIYLVSKTCLTANLKVDWDRTREGAFSSSIRNESLSTTSLTGTEIALKTIWMELLKVELVFSNSDFFSLGGHSLLVLELLDRIEKRFEICLDLSNLFRHSTLSGMASRIDSLLNLPRTFVNSKFNEQKKEIGAIRVAEYLKLSQRKVSSDLVSLQQHIFNIPLESRPAAESIVEILEELEYRHPILGMVLIWNHGDVLLSPSRAPVNVRISFGDRIESDLVEKTQLNLGEIGLYDVVHLRSPKGSKFDVLQFRLDSSFFDYECCSILRRCVSRIMSSRNMQSSSEERGSPESNFLRHLKEERYKASADAEDYWKEIGKKVSPILNFGEARPELFTKRASRLFRILLEADVRRLRQFSIRQECSVSQVVLAAFGLALGRITNREDVAVAMQSSRRTVGHLADALGIYQSQFYVNLKFDQNSSLKSGLTMVVEEFRRALSFSAAPSATVWGPVPGRPSRSYGSPISAFYLYNEIKNGSIRFPASTGLTSGDVTLVTYDATNAGEIGLSLKYYADGISISTAEKLISGVVEILTTNC